MIDEECVVVSHGVACEACRSKKRKCDRVSPVCSQCAHDSSSCHYPQINKRGLPVGYLSKLESRLADTENALCQLACQYYAGVSIDPNEVLKPCPDRVSGDTSKSERMKEWETVPLKTMLDVKKWWSEKVDQGIGVNLELAHATPNRPIQLADSGATVSGYGSKLGPLPSLEPSAPSQVQPSDTRWTPLHQDGRERDYDWKLVNQMESVCTNRPHASSASATQPGSDSTNSKAKQLAAQKSFLYF
ncbi:hypothetical protein GGI43DRAFT_418492 [Trichoderma evansii]